MSEVRLYAQFPLRVGVANDLVVVGEDDGATPFALIMTLPAADETARRMREAVGRHVGEPVPTGHVGKITLAPPTSPFEPARITLHLSDGREATMTVALDDLEGLTTQVRAALAAAGPTRKR